MERKAGGGGEERGKGDSEREWAPTRFVLFEYELLPSHPPPPHTPRHPPPPLPPRECVGVGVGGRRREAGTEGWREGGGGGGVLTPDAVRVFSPEALDRHILTSYVLILTIILIFFVMILARDDIS